MDAATNAVLKSDYIIRENYQSAHRLFQALASNGVQPATITIDGLPCVLRALKAVWPTITVQRCIVHIQRQGLSWLRRYPSTAAGRELRDILLMLTAVATAADKRRFIHRFRSWEYRYGPYIRTLNPHHKVYSDLQRSRSLIGHALPDMFHYLDDPNIPSSTNRIEGYFSRVKSVFNRHNGMSKSHRAQYFAWYVYLKNTNT
jgi:transposase-like protein